MTSSWSRPDSHGISSVNMVTHCRHVHGMRVMSVPQRLEEGEAQAEHAGSGLPSLHQSAALRAIEREVAEDRQPIGVLARRLDGELIGSSAILIAFR